jgi:hypothetical protein
MRSQKCGKIVNYSEPDLNPRRKTRARARAMARTGAIEGDLIFSQITDNR